MAFTHTLPKMAAEYDVPVLDRTAGTSPSQSFSTNMRRKQRNVRIYTLNKYEEFGIHILSEHDELFYDAEFPDGWEVISPESGNIWYKVQFHGETKFMYYHVNVPGNDSALVYFNDFTKFE